LGKEADIDGFRCDLASWVEADFWEQARPETEKIKPLFFIGEYDELENPEYGKTFDASYSWKWMHLTEDFYKNNLPLSNLIDLLKQYSVFSIPVCELGLHPITMKTAGMVPSMRNMVKWPKL
jgi:glycosidase